MKKIRLVHVISHLGVGGAEGVLYQLLSHLKNDQFSQTVVYFHSGPYVEKIKKLGIKTYQVKGAVCMYDPVFMYRFIFLIKKLKPNCLHTLLWAANFVGRITAWMLGIAHVEVLHNNVDQNGIFRTMLDRITASVAGRRVAVSDGIVQSLAEYAPWMALPKVTVIKNGISFSSVKKSNVSRSDLGIPEGWFVIGSVGRFEPVKNYGLLLTTFALLYDTHRKACLVLVGQGSQERFLRTRAYDLGIEDRVFFVTGKDAQPYYALFDCFVLSSYKEGISMALLEAMGNGVAPIVTSTVSTHDVIEHEKDGFLVPAGNAKKLAQAIDLMIQSRALRRKIAQAAQVRVKNNFKIEKMAAAYATLYQQTLSQQQSLRR